ncbi:MAG: hypothetical protein AB7E51_07635 [Pseudodesulfovibrio sp.]|jgi:hypothetical protein|uniref:Uncharacterized protein n=1 Tax=Pseudodesulfovibrio indicus TaxID=1716143 RepID=A0A126QQ55_9BACT|nr:hypothetical protein [Pseudodesulfovibrio indicus]AMK11858.1 hypothetical protein AWY79_12410 [Pseudodesulfovibrio indicus]TDT87120.1 hypothetical protein EDC59_1097 [Pseudodesulfovibrio indicus]
MNLSAPQLLTWIIAVIIGLLGILIQLDVMSVPALEDLVRPFWLVSTGFVILAVSNIFRRL